MEGNFMIEKCEEISNYILFFNLNYFEDLPFSM